MKKALVLMCSFMLTFGALCSLAEAMDVTLTWDANTEPDLAGYNIYWSTVQGVPVANRTKVNIPLATVGFNKTAPEFTVKGLSDTVRIYFVATAYDNEVPELESGYSNEVSALYADLFKGKAPVVPGMLKLKTVTTTVSKTVTTTTVAVTK